MLTFTILLAQGGLPLHAHYCKGMLESISVFFTTECDDHKEAADLPACCSKLTASGCTSKNSDCCDDEVKVLLQDFDSLVPHFDKMDQAPALAKTDRILPIPSITYSSQRVLDHDDFSNGPPIYILFQSLKLDV